MATAEEYAVWIVDNEDKKGTEDFEIVVAAYKEALEEEEEIFVPSGDEGTALGRGFSRGIDVAGRGFGSALQGLGKVTGFEGVEEFGTEMVAENEAQLAEQEAMATRLKDVEGVNTGLDFFLETLGETAPQTGLSLGAGAASGALAGSVFGPVGTAAGALAGAAISQLPFFYGNNREAQKEAIEQGLRVEMDEGTAFLSAIPQATLDAVAERFMVGKFLTPKAIRAGGLFTRAARGAGAGVISEVPTELGQTLIERAQAGLELDSDEAFDIYTETAVAAGLVGGTLGGGAAGISRDSREVDAERKAAEDEIEAAAAAAEAELEEEKFYEGVQAEEDAKAAEAEEKFYEGVQAEEDAKAAEAAKLEAERAAAGTPTPIVSEEEKEDSAAIAVPTVTTEQAAEEQKQRYSLLQQVIEDTPTNNYNTLQGAFARRLAEAGITDTAVTEAEKNTIVSAVNVQRAPPEVQSRGPMVTETIEDTSVGTAELEAEIPERAPVSQDPTQASFPGMSRKRVAGQAPVESEPEVEGPRIIDKAFLDRLGISAQAGIRKRREGQDFNDPEVRQDFIKFVNNKTVKAETRENVAKELEGVSQDQLSLFGQKPPASPTPPTTPPAPTTPPTTPPAPTAPPTTPTAGPEVIAAPEETELGELIKDEQRKQGYVVELEPEVESLTKKSGNTYPLTRKGEIKPYAVIKSGQPTRFYSAKRTAERAAKDEQGSTFVATADLDEEQAATLDGFKATQKAFAAFDAKQKPTEEKPVETKPEETLEFDPEEVSWVRRAGYKPVWGNKEIALRIGYDQKTNEVLYIPIKQQDGKVKRFSGNPRDVSNPVFWGKVFSGAELAELREAKRKAVAIDEAAYNRQVNGPFKEGSNVAFSTNLPKELANTAQQFIEMLGIKARVYVTTFEDASNPEEAKLKNLYGPFARIAGAESMGEGTQGYTQQLTNGDHVIVLKPQSRRSKAIETLTHEIGHVFEATEYQNASPRVQEAIRAEYEKWRSKARKGTVRELYNSLRARTSAKAAIAKNREILDEPAAQKLKPYWFSDGEWFADQVSRWAVTSEKPLTIVDKFFARVAAGMRRLYESMAGKIGLPNTVFKDYLDSRAVTPDPLNIPFPEAVSGKKAADAPPETTGPKAVITATAGKFGGKASDRKVTKGKKTVAGRSGEKPLTKAQAAAATAKRKAAADQAAATKEAEKAAQADSAAARKKAFDAAVDKVYQDKVKNAGGEANLEAAELITLRRAALRDVRARGSLFNVQTQFDPDLDAPLDNNVIKNIKEGNLKGALTALAYAADNPRVAKIASQLTKFVGDTRVVIVPTNPTDALGKRYRAALNEEPNTKGAFIYSDVDPAIDNVILLDENTGVTAHTLIHEMSHVTTIQELQNPSSPVTRQLTNLYNEVKGALSGYYGTQSVEEFVAEVRGNYKFRQELASIPIDKGATTGLARYLDIMKKFLRRVFGLPNDAAGTADKLIESILAPYAGVRGSGTLYNASTMDKAKNFFEDTYESVPTFKEIGERGILNTLLSPVPDKAKRFALGMLDLNAITKLAEGKIPGVDKLLDIVRKQSSVINKLNTGIENLAQRTGAWANKHAEEMQELSRILTRSTYLHLDPSLTKQEAKEKYTAEKIYQSKVKNAGGAANLSTKEKEAFRNAALREANENFAEWESLNKRFYKLSPEGRGFYKSWRNLYKSMYDDIRRIMEVRLGAEMKDGEKSKLVANKLFAKLTEGGVIDPYFPLMRFGKFWLEYSAVDPSNGNIEYYMEAFDSVKDRKAAMKQVEDHWNNPSPENKALVEAQIAAQLDSPTGKTKTRAEAIKVISAVNAFSRVEDSKYKKNAPSSSFVNSVLDILEANGIKDDNPAQDQIMRLFLDTLPERSFANSFRHRKNTRGAVGDVTPTERQIPNHDVLAGLKNRAASIGQQLARIEYGAQMRAYGDEITAWQKDVSSSIDFVSDDEKTTIRLLTEELVERANWAASPNVDPWARLATSFGFNMTLGLNISSALVNLSQIPMVVLPYLGAQYGYTESMKAIWNAKRVFLSSGTTREIESWGPDGEITVSTSAMPSLDNINFDEASNDIRRFQTLSELADSLGQLNRSIAYDTVEIDSIDSPMSQVNAVTGFIFHHGERMNRQIAMMAAYDLALQKKLKDKGLQPNQWEKLDIEERNALALDAINVTEMTNGGIAAAAAPRLAQNGVGKVAFLFKRYGSAMYFMLYDLIDSAISSDKPEMRKMARNQLMGVFGGAAVVAGVQGLPFFGVIAMLSNMFKGDDEEDFETVTRKYLGEGPYGGAFNYLFGVDVASRMGLSNLIFRDRLIEKDQSIFFTAAEQVGGPVLGSLLQLERGYDLWGRGEVLRGVEAAMPAAIRNGFKSVRFANEGPKTLRGDLIAEDISPGHIAAQFMGFAPAEYTRQLQQNASLKKVDRAINEERTRILRKYYISIRQGNGGAVDRTMEDLVDFNKRHPEVSITPDTIKRSMRQHMKTTSNMHYGVTLSPRLAAKLKAQAAGWDDTPDLMSDLGI